MYQQMIEEKLVQKFIQGIPSFDEMMDMIKCDYETETTTIFPHRIFIFDDLMMDISELKDNTLSKMATVLGHHCNVTIILLSQMLFMPNDKKFNIFAENTHCVMILKSPRNMSKIIYIARQTSPYNIQYIVDAYKAATRPPYGYLWFDFVQSTEDNLRVMTNFLPDELPVRVFSPIAN